VSLLTLPCRSSVLNNEAFNATLSSKLNGLTIDIHQVLRVLDDQSKSSIPEASSNIDPHVKSNLEACVRSAKKMVSSAASIVSERSVSGSQVDGSLFGDDMSERQRRRVESWIPENTIFEDPNETFPTSLSSPSIDDTLSSAVSDSIFSDDYAETTVTGLTSLTSESNKFRFDDHQIVEEHQIDEANQNVEADTISLQSGTSPALHTVNTNKRNGTTGGVTFPPAPPENQLTINLETAGAQAADLTHATVDDSDTGSNIEDDFIQEWRKLGMLKFEQREYAAAELLLKKTLTQSELKYGIGFGGRERILGILASACAHQGRKETVEEILDEYRRPAVWKHRVLVTLVISFLEEGKLNQASEILEKYGAEFEERDDALVRLVSICSKHSAWSVAAGIFGRYMRFQGRERVLDTCISACRQKSNWDEAEGFLLELLKVKTRNEVERSATTHALAEVYLAKKDVKSAQDYCQRAVDSRRKKLGKKHHLFQESVYLIAKIIYEANGNPIEFDIYRNLLPTKVQGMYRNEKITYCRMP
jgi:tetratricopeptide (TPR) repeat protein